MRWASRNPAFCILSYLNKAEQDHIKLDTAGKLAALLYDSKLITVNHHARNTDDEAFDEKDMTRMAKASIARQIQKHINAESADIVSGDYEGISIQYGENAVVVLL